MHLLNNIRRSTDEEEMNVYICGYTEQMTLSTHTRAHITKNTNTHTHITHITHLHMQPHTHHTYAHATTHTHTKYDDIKQMYNHTHTHTHNNGEIKQMYNHTRTWWKHMSNTNQHLKESTFALCVPKTLE